jgi:hypothetical protein
VITACGGTLTDEQRKKMREGSEQQAVVKVTDAEITDAAFAKGRSVLAVLSGNNADSLAASMNVKIHWLEAGASTNSLAVEQQLMDAYINSVITGTPMRDNIQKIGTDSMLYTSVVVLTRPDSTIEIKGTWNIWMSKKQLILSMGN